MILIKLITKLAAYKNNDMNGEVTMSSVHFRHLGGGDTGSALDPPIAGQRGFLEWVSSPSASIQTSLSTNNDGSESPRVAAQSGRVTSYNTMATLSDRGRASGAGQLIIPQTSSKDSEPAAFLV